jgi:hypothetical protein
LAENQICSAGVQVVMQAITTGLMPLQELDLSRNELIKYTGLQMIGVALPNLATLTKINVSKCCPDESSSGQMRETPEKTEARFRASQALLEGMKRALHIAELDTQNYSFSPQLQSEINFYKCLIQHGRYLLTINHGLASTVWCFILGKFDEDDQGRCATGVIYYLLREQPNLVQQR